MLPTSYCTDHPAGSQHVWLFDTFALLGFTAVPKSAKMTTDYGDFVPSNGRVEFTNTGADSDTEQTIVLNIANDDTWEDTEELQISMDFHGSTPPSCHMFGELRKVTIIILDDDKPGKSKTNVTNETFRKVPVGGWLNFELQGFKVKISKKYGPSLEVTGTTAQICLHKATHYCTQGQ